MGGPPFPVAIATVTRHLLITAPSSRACERALFWWYFQETSPNHFSALFNSICMVGKTFLWPYLSISCSKTSTMYVAQTNLYRNPNNYLWETVDHKTITLGLSYGLWAKGFDYVNKMVDNVIKNEKAIWGRIDAQPCSLLWQSLWLSLSQELVPLFRPFKTCISVWIKVKSLYTNDLLILNTSWNLVNLKKGQI